MTTTRVAVSVFRTVTVRGDVVGGEPIAYGNTQFVPQRIEVCYSQADDGEWGSGVPTISGPQLLKSGKLSDKSLIRMPVWRSGRPQWVTDFVTANMPSVGNPYDQNGGTA